LVLKLYTGERTCAEPLVIASDSTPRVSITSLRMVFITGSEFDLPPLTAFAAAAVVVNKPFSI
jgi:hypothetical protein